MGIQSIQLFSFFLFFMTNVHHKMLGEKRKLDIRKIVSFYKTITQRIKAHLDPPL